MSDLTEALRQQKTQRVGGGPTIDTNSMVVRRSSPFYLRSTMTGGQNVDANPQSGNNNLSSMLRNGRKLFGNGANSDNTTLGGPTSSTSIYTGAGNSPGVTGALSGAGMADYGGASTGMLSGGSFGAGANTAGVSDALGSAGMADYSAAGVGGGLGSGVGAGSAAGGTGGAGSGGSALAGAGPWGWLAALIYGNEKYNRNVGNRSSGADYWKDLITGHNIIKNDADNTWGPKLDPGNRTGFQGDYQTLGNFTNGNLGGTLKSLDDSSAAKPYHWLSDLLRKL